MSVNNANIGGPSAPASHQIPVGNNSSSAGAVTEQQPAQHQQPVEEKKAEEPKKKYVRREVTLVGDDICGGCKNVEEVVNNQIKPNSDVETTFTKIYSDSAEGKQIIKDKKLVYIPFVTECLIPTDPNEKPVCKEYKNASEYNYKLKVNE